MFCVLMRLITTIETSGKVTNWLEPVVIDESDQYYGLPMANTPPTTLSAL